VLLVCIVVSKLLLVLLVVPESIPLLEVACVRPVLLAPTVLLARVHVLDVLLENTTRTLVLLLVWLVHRVTLLLLLLVLLAKLVRKVNIPLLLLLVLHVVPVTMPTNMV
jgi:hypothetical protein